MAANGFSFGVSQFTTWPWTFEQDVAAYARLGVNTIELCEFKTDPQRPDDAIARIRDAGLTISSVQARSHSLFPDQPRPEPRFPAERMALLRVSIAKFAKAGSNIPFVSITGAAPGGNFREAFAVAVREYRALAEFAADYGARV